MSPRATLVLQLLVLLTLAGCDRTKSEVESHPPPATPPPAAPPPVQVVHLSEQVSRPAPARLVAIGDLHGDLDHARRALREAGATDAHDAWIGGKLVLVQTGDEIDRGDDDRTIVDLVEKLKTDAKAAGGELVALLGNHEIMNAMFDYRYVTPGGFGTFSMMSDVSDAAVHAPNDLDPQARGRAAAFGPGGVYAKIFARRPLFVKVGDTLFVHGGILPKHVAYGLDKMNDEVDDWLVGKRRDVPSIVVADDGPVWTRVYSDDTGGPPACSALEQVLAATGAARMVVGHTVHLKGITSACEGKVWRIDVGLAHYYGGPIETLEIVGDKVTVLHETR